MKLAAIEIENFGCIGSPGLHIAIDRIVVLIGPNNVGKSTVLRAYRTFASNGAPLLKADFHNEDPERAVEIRAIFVELSARDRERLGARKWLHTLAPYGECIRVKWRWEQPGLPGRKWTWNPGGRAPGWVEGGLGGWDTLLHSCVPVPLLAEPYENPGTTEATILQILADAVQKKLAGDRGRLRTLLAELQLLAEEVRDELSGELGETCGRIAARLQQIFPEHGVAIQPEVGKFDAARVISAGSYIRVTEPAGRALPLSAQGTGLKWAFLWAAIQALAELGRMRPTRRARAIAPDRPRILLIDEPESFLHPPAVRAAREALYTLAGVDGWQVMIATHSPVFIDVSKPHTTIIRVDRQQGGGTRVFSTERADFDADARRRLQMVRACHPTVNEFFFADHVILVEGETEHAVLTELLEREGQPPGIHVVNCMGKANLPLFAHILNHFRVAYTVLHDADAPRSRHGGKWRRNAMWTMNERILATVAERAALGPDGPPAYVVAHVPDFEGHYFNTRHEHDKPYQALKILAGRRFAQARRYRALRELVRQLIAHEHPGQYENMDQLGAKVAAWVRRHPPEEPEAWLLAPALAPQPGAAQSATAPASPAAAAARSSGPPARSSAK